MERLELLKAKKATKKDRILLELEDDLSHMENTKELALSIYRKYIYPLILQNEICLKEFDLLLKTNQKDKYKGWM